MQVKSNAEYTSILQYFRPALPYQPSLRPLFWLFLTRLLKTEFTVYNKYQNIMCWSIFIFSGICAYWDKAGISNRILLNLGPVGVPKVILSTIKQLEKIQSYYTGYFVIHYLVLRQRFLTGSIGNSRQLRELLEEIQSYHAHGLWV